MNKNIIIMLSISVLVISCLIYCFSPYLTTILEKTRLINRYDSTKIKFDYDLIVVGSGLAGLTSAFEANKISNGKINILIIEKAPKFGGNSAKATSGINILNSPLQEKEKVKDSFQLFFNDTMKSGKNINNKILVKTVVEDSHFLFDFFTKDAEADLSKLGILGGHSVPRTARPTNATVGYHLVSKLYEKLQKQKNINFIFNANVNELITNKFSTKVIGLKYNLINETNKSIELKAKTIILASGGYGHDFGTDDSLLKEFVPHLMKFPTTNSPLTQGNGMKLGRKIGIELIDMKQVQVHPTGFVDLNKRFEKNKILAPELLRGVGGILINQKGKRFVNELEKRDFVTDAIIKNCEMAKSDSITQYESFLLINQNSLDAYGGNVFFYVKRGLFRKYKNLKEFTEKMNISESYENLVNTIKEYNESYDSKKDKFNKKVFPQKFNADEVIYVAVITPSIHYCMGGLKMTKNGELVKKNGEIMGGLFGAGEVTGGVHGGNRLGGNSLMECGVYGRRAGRAAFDYIGTYN